MENPNKKEILEKLLKQWEKNLVEVDVNIKYFKFKVKQFQDKMKKEKDDVKRGELDLQKANVQRLLTQEETKKEDSIEYLELLRKELN